MPITSERRRYGRVQLDAPLHALFGETRVHVIEMSVVGFRIAHEGRLAGGESRHLVLEWKGAVIELLCSVVRSTLFRLGKTLDERSIYHTGLSIVRFENDGFDQLRNLLGDRILRALDEMKANARGIPPLSAYMYQPEKGELYRRCEWINGIWRKTETIRAKQPPNGFTVSAEVDPEHVDMLCETWERTSEEGRRLTQLLAELSVSRAEGIPTRRYVP